MGRSVYTHEMGENTISEEIKRKSKADFLMICKEPPCEDCISRKAVLRINECHHGQMPNHVNFQIYEEIQALPSVSLMPKWIPVNERLPKNKSYVLTTIKIPGRVPHARSGWYQDGVFINDNGDTWQKEDPEVVGWMYLPEPYKEDAE